MSIDTLLIILHFGSKDLTNRCLKQLINDKTIEIVVVDNDPTSIYKIEQNYFENVKIIKTKGNLGFGKANNLGVNTYLQDYHKYIFILNNDVIIDSVNVQNLKTSLRKNNADIAGPVLYFDNSKNEDIWACGGYIRKFNFEIRGIDDILQEIPYEVQYIPAAAVIFTKSVWEKIGGFSEKYFLGYEEAEICIRAKRLGKKVIAVPSSFGLHKVGMSKSGNSDRYLYNYYRSKIIFAKFYIGNFIGSLLIYPITFFESILIEPRRFFIWIKVFQHEFMNKPFVHESLPLN